MDELIIQTHDFNTAKNQLKEFSEKIPSSVDLQTVATNGGLFDLFDHNVTGAEFNILTAQIQKHLISIHNLHNESIKEFGQVYKALEALDKDYIQAIILSIKAAETASNQAKKSAFEAEKNSLDIDKTIKVQTQTINVLKQFKEQIDKYEQLKNIDEIWSDCQTLKKDIKSINIRMENHEEEIDRKTKEQMNDIRNLLDEDKRNYEAQNKILYKKLKIAYIVAGSSVCFILIDIILHILGVA
ncbi:hypothetical protein [Syntrophomonas wolfei]|uniref:Uncharacterized protein n=1 Tax=Syntrophomonas wolfei subsp. wolfei (strain DSM 2245B / Goettingen) TaxID=335541 RepID=Q0AV92_SYNWW|nr:hypothetical protein [Syntrophomonas wolfei]ABI69362.1 hypothetical protein Swol_2068 [Syntrophomonas wolfei subsp. wolfei str. Goettingen G311]